MKRLILIRHGQTHYSALRRYCGFQNIPLNKAGKEEVHRLRERVKHFKVDKVYSSDLKRCTGTARILFAGKAIHKRKGLREIDFGSLGGLKYDNLKNDYPKIYSLWTEHPEQVKMPKGESMKDFARRVERSFDKIVRENKKNAVLLVAHGGSIRIILLKLLKKGLNKMWEIEQDASALNVIDFARGEAKILKMNDTSHLR